MKVRFKKKHAFGDMIFEPGWVAEFSQPDAEALIADGVCEQVADNVRLLRYETDASLLDSCVAPEEAELNEENQLVKFKKNK